MNRTNLVLSTAAALLIASSSFCALAADPAKEDTVKIQVTPDRKEALYQCGEKVKFQGAVTKNGKPLTTGKATVRITNDGRKIISTQEMDLSKNNPFEIEGTMAVPGFLRCEVTLDKDKGCAGAGFEPEKIQPAPNLPEDFNKFWSDGVRELDQIPPDVKLEPLPEFSTPEFDCFKVSFANIDNTRIYGFLSVPKGKKGPFPALVHVPGAGSGHCFPDTKFVKDGIIVLFMNVHQFDPPTDADESKKTYAALNKTLSYFNPGSPDRDQYYFKKSILGINRAINWLAGRPDVDREHLGMFGGSQGGAFTLVLSGLNKNIKAASANVPGLCDHAGYQLDRRPGWPEMVNDPEMLKMSGYFDAVNFARNITCPIIVAVGFIDTVCSPSSVYAAYNTIPSPKMIFNEPGKGHGMSGEFCNYQTEWMRGKLGLDHLTFLNP